MSSNVAQNYPYRTETEEERATAVAESVARFEGLGDRISTETTPLPDPGPDEPGRPHRWWVFVCPKPPFDGRLHVAGYALERHALYTVCDTCGDSYLR